MTGIDLGSFLRKIFGFPSGSQANLAVFGKHPGWDDHIDDIGLDTDQLIAVRRELYLGGIAGNIDSGEWDRLEPGLQIEFGHVFVWIFGEEIVVGRLWASSDGKGRSRYPMVIAAQCGGHSLEWMLGEVLPRLEQLETDCRAAVDASRIRQLAQSCRRELVTVASAPVKAKAASSERKSLARLAESPELGIAQSGLISLFYHMQKDMAAYFADAREPRADVRHAPPRPGHVRVPWCAPTPADALSLWSGFLKNYLVPHIPMLLIMPTGHPWLDIIVGDPTNSELYCLRASRQAMALTTEIPYSVDDEFAARVRRLIAGANEIVP